MSSLAQELPLWSTVSRLILYKWSFLYVATVVNIRKNIGDIFFEAAPSLLHVPPPPYCENYTSTLRFA